MKNITFVLILLMFSVKTFSQARIGYTPEQIKKEYKDSIYHLETGTDNSGNKYISIKLDGITVYHFLNTSGICAITTVSPDNTASLNAYVELYNKLYVVISPKNWRLYTEDGYIDCELKWASDKTYYFYWTVGKLN